MNGFALQKTPLILRGVDQCVATLANRIDPAGGINLVPEGAIACLGEFFLLPPGSRVLTMHLYVSQCLVLYP